MPRWSEKLFLSSKSYIVTGRRLMNHYFDLYLLLVPATLIAALVPLHQVGLSATVKSPVTVLQETLGYTLETYYTWSYE